MKQIVLFLGFLLILTSCSCSRDSSDDEMQNSFLGSWKLVQMYGSFYGSKTIGDAMEWQESYTFLKNGVFSKKRTQNNVVTEIQGTYYIRKISGETSLVLTYPEDNAIVGSCTSQHEEDLHFNDDTTLSNSWLACDGLGLIYAKTQK